MLYILIVLAVLISLSAYLIWKRKHGTKLSPGIKELCDGVPKKKCKIMLSLFEFLATRLILAVLIGFVLPYSSKITALCYFATMLFHFIFRIVRFSESLYQHFNNILLNLCLLYVSLLVVLEVVVKTNEKVLEVMTLVFIYGFIIV